MCLRYIQALEKKKKGIPLYSSGHGQGCFYFSLSKGQYLLRAFLHDKNLLGLIQCVNLLGSGAHHSIVIISSHLGQCLQANRNRDKSLIVKPLLSDLVMLTARTNRFSYVYCRNRFSLCLLHEQIYHVYHINKQI